MFLKISAPSLSGRCATQQSHPRASAQKLQRIVVTPYSQSGFATPGSSKASTKPTQKIKRRKVDIAKELGLNPTTSASPQPKQEEEDTGSWFSVASINDFDKPIKPVILKTGRAIVLYKVGDDVYCSDANSTAYQYPMVDAKLLDLPGGPAVEVPLDGTQYDLKTGKVLKWCPADNPMRAVLGTLKKASKPVDLPVFRTRVNENGRISVTLI